MTLEEKLKLERKEGWEGGLREGRLEGKCEGLLEGKLQAATKLKAEGIALDVIAKVTDLPPEKIQEL